MINLVKKIFKSIVGLPRLCRGQSLAMTSGIITAGVVLAFAAIYFVVAGNTAFVLAAQTPPVISSATVTGPFVEYAGAARIYYKLVVNGSGLNSGINPILVVSSVPLYATSCSGGNYCSVAIYQDIFPGLVAGAQFNVVARLAGNTQLIYGALTFNIDSAPYTAVIPGGSVSYQQTASGALVPVAPGGTQGGGTFVSPPVLDSVTIGNEQTELGITGGRKYWPITITGSNFKLSSIAVAAGIPINNTSFDSGTSLRSFIYADIFSGIGPGTTVGVVVRTGTTDSQIKYAVIPQLAPVSNVPVLTAAAISDLQEGIGGKYYTVTVLAKNIKVVFGQQPALSVNGGSVLTTVITADKFVTGGGSGSLEKSGQKPNEGFKQGDIFGAANTKSFTSGDLFGPSASDLFGPATDQNRGAQGLGASNINAIGANQIRQPNADEKALVGNLPISTWTTLKPGDVLSVAVRNMGNHNPLFGPTTPDSVLSNSLAITVPEAPVTGGPPVVVSAAVSELIHGAGGVNYYNVTAQCSGCFSHGFGEASTLMINGGVVMTDFLPMSGLNGSTGGNIGLKAALSLDKWLDLRPGKELGVQICNPNYVDNTAFGRTLQSYTCSQNSVQLTIAGPAQEFVAPAILSIEPASVSAGTPGVAVTVSGGGFRSSMYAPSVMLVNGEPVFTSYASNDKVFAAIPAKFLETPGTLSVQVRNPGFNDPTQPPKLDEQISGAFAFVVAQAAAAASPQFQFSSSVGGGAGVVAPVDAPVITNVLPPSAPAGSGDFDAIVIGENFYEYSEVRWNGIFIPTQFVSDTELRATIPGGALGVTGNFNITVYNPSAEEVSAMQAQQWIGGTPTISPVTPAGGSLPQFSPLPILPSLFNQGPAAVLPTTFTLRSPASVSLAPSVPEPVIRAAPNNQVAPVAPSVLDRALSFFGLSQPTAAPAVGESSVNTPVSAPAAGPQVCTADYVPVCGSDGKTYSNACEAGQAGIVKYVNGKCAIRSGVSGGSSQSAPASNVTENQPSVFDKVFNFLGFNQVPAAPVLFDTGGIMISRPPSQSLAVVQSVLPVGDDFSGYSAGDLKGKNGGVGWKTSWISDGRLNGVDWQVTNIVNSPAGTGYKSIQCNNCEENIHRDFGPVTAGNLSFYATKPIGAITSVAMRAKLVEEGAPSDWAIYIVFRGDGKIYVNDGANLKLVATKNNDERHKFGIIWDGAAGTYTLVIDSDALLPLHLKKSVAGALYQLWFMADTDEHPVFIDSINIEKP